MNVLSLSSEQTSVKTLRQTSAIERSAKTLSQASAIECIAIFAQQFGMGHLRLAFHAAFPLALTPDMLYQIWANFTPEVDWIAVADILLSHLCREVGFELYEMDEEIRRLLLHELKEDKQLGQQRIEELADFLILYVAEQFESEDIDQREFAQNQRWTALLYARPNETVRQLTEAISNLLGDYTAQHKQDVIGNLLRLTSLLETPAKLLPGLQPLLHYAQGAINFVCGDLENAKIHFAALLKESHHKYIPVSDLFIPEVNDPLLLGNYLYVVGLNWLRMRQGDIPLLASFADEELATLAEEFVQDFLIKLTVNQYARLKTYRGEGSFQKWAAVGLKRMIDKELKKESWHERERLFDDDKWREPAPQPPTVERLPVQLILEHCLQTLPERERLVFLRRVAQEESAQTVADDLATTTNAIHILLSRAKNRLRLCLEEQGIRNSHEL